MNFNIVFYAVVLLSFLNFVNAADCNLECVNVDCEDVSSNCSTSCDNNCYSSTCNKKCQKSCTNVCRSCCKASVEETLKNDNNISTDVNINNVVNNVNNISNPVHVISNNENHINISSKCCKTKVRSPIIYTKTEPVYIPIYQDRYYSIPHYYPVVVQGKSCNTCRQCCYSYNVPYCQRQNYCNTCQIINTGYSSYYDGYTRYAGNNGFNSLGGGYGTSPLISPFHSYGRK